MAKSRKKPRKRKYTAQRIEAVLERAMRDYAYYCEKEARLGGMYVLVLPQDHSAFIRARRSLMVLLREARRG